MGEKTTRVTILGLNYSPEPTGIAPYTAGLASGLTEAGFDVRVVTAYPHYPAWRIADGYTGHRMKDVVGGVRVARIRPYMPPQPSGIKRLLVEISFGVGSVFTRWNRPEVVVLVSPALFAVAIAQLRARLSRNRPAVIVWVQDIYSLGVAETGAMGGRGARMMGRIEGAVLRSADRVVVIHDRFERYVATRLGVERSNIRVVRNWTHFSPITSDREAFRRKFGWGDEVVVLHAGNMGAKQALENVVEAARLADANFANIRFVLLGNGNQRLKLEQLASGVIRLDFLESLDDADFQGAMAAADVLLVNEKAGIAEMAVPSKLTSYFSAARPVLVATDEGSITAEEIAAAGAGIRVDAEDPESLLRESLLLGGDPLRAAELGRNGAAFQQELLSQSSAMSNYAEIINSLAVERGR